MVLRREQAALVLPSTIASEATRGQGEAARCADPAPGRSFVRRAFRRRLMRRLHKRRLRLRGSMSRGGLARGSPDVYSTVHVRVIGSTLRYGLTEADIEQVFYRYGDKFCIELDGDEKPDVRSSCRGLGRRI